MQHVIINTMVETDTFDYKSSEIITTQDGREISVRDLEELVLAGQSWSSLRTPDRLSRILRRRFAIPECNDPRLVGSFPVLEWLKMPPTEYKPSIIYCTWAAAGGKDSLENTQRQLDAFDRLGVKPNLFIIDAGWLIQAGDWLQYDEKKFTGGMERATKAIHDFGSEAWIWLGPFIVSLKSQLAKDHPKWLVKDINTEPLIFKLLSTSNMTPHYIINYQNPEVQKYLADVCGQIKTWGFDGIKADYLSNAFFIPNLDQLQSLTLIHDFLGQIRKSGLGVLACGCPFPAALGVADFIRVSNDSGLPAGINSEIAKKANHVLIDGVERGVKAVTPLIRKFGINADPDMFYQFDIGPKDLERLKQIQEFSIRNGGCLTLGDDFRNLNSGQVENVRQLVSLFKSINSNF